MIPHHSHLVVDISDLSLTADLICTSCDRTDEELAIRCPAAFNKASWNYHLHQIGEHIDAMERHASRAGGHQLECLSTTIRRLRKRVEDSKI